MMTDPGASTNVGGQVVEGELLRVARLCHPDAESLGRLTLRPPCASWPVWRERIFDPIVRPALDAAHEAVTRGRRRDLLACDAGLDAVLPGPVAAASRSAGRRLALAHTVPPGEKTWRHFQESVRREETFGHLAVMFAVRAAAFHLAPRAAASALLYLEARGGCPSAPPAFWLELVSEGLPGDKTHRLRAA